MTRKIWSVGGQQGAQSGWSTVRAVGVRGSEAGQVGRSHQVLQTVAEARGKCRSGCKNI